jgi:hypothetical protein
MNHAAPQQNRPRSASSRQQRSPSSSGTTPTRARVGRRRTLHRQLPIAQPQPEIPIDLFIALMA